MGAGADWYTKIQKGEIYKHTWVHKFGRNASVGTSFVPVTLGGIYLTPQAASATNLRVKAGNTNDTAAGSGAQEITLTGLNELGVEVTEAIATAGTSPSSTTSTTFMRLYRAYVSASGTYATSAAGSHAADIVIEKGAGSEDWATLSAADFPRSQTEIAVYSVPTGYTAYVKSFSGFTDSAKITNIIFFKRETILDAAAPYSAMRILFEERLEGGQFTYVPESPVKITGPADVGFMAKVNSTTAEVDIDFEIMVVDDS